MRLNLHGHKFGRFTVISESSRKGPSREIFWTVKCDCGNVREVIGSVLNTGRTQSCGCLAVERSRSATFKGQGVMAFNRLVRTYKRHALARHLEFSISNDDFLRISKSNCTYCGCQPYSEIESESTSGGFKYNGLDRIDSALGYTLNNVVPCCHRCNMAKSDMSVTEFREWILRVHSQWASVT